MIFRGKLEPN